MNDNRLNYNREHVHLSVAFCPDSCFVVKVTPSNGSLRNFPCFVAV